MHIKRIVIVNFRNFQLIDAPLETGVTCIIGENNTGKTNFIHAVRLACDITLSSFYRQLTEHDINSKVDISLPSQVIVSLDLVDYLGENDRDAAALVGAWEVSPNLARITYRFRPKDSVRQAILDKSHPGTCLTLEDYGWELTVGGPNDPAKVKWDETIGSSFRMSDLQYIQVTMLPALRDVINDLKTSRFSIISKLLDNHEITDAEKNELVTILKGANEKVSSMPTLKTASQRIKESFLETTGEGHAMGISLGMADPSFASITRSLSLLLTNESISDFEVMRNGLGLNNILYICMLLDYFDMRLKSGKVAGQLLLVEEPEAHLHPQLQRVLYASLTRKSVQVVVTTHSTHVSSHSRLSSYLCLTNTKTGTLCATPTLHAGLSKTEEDDLGRYLDSTKSTLLFAKQVILVEGAAEVFLIPALIKTVRKLDLDRRGISIVAIHGVHFSSYSKLFSKDCLPKKCAILTDGDMKPSDAVIHDVDEGDEIPPEDNLLALENEYVKVFQNATTFERTLAIPGLFEVILATVSDIAAPISTQRIKEAITAHNAARTVASKKEQLELLATRLLKLSKRVGKARFSQLMARHAGKAKSLPDYINNALSWLTT
ncbi:MAG: AAA family ATPase [Gemmatales bacterium]